MKLFIKTLSTVCIILTLISCGNTNSKPSIKDNSTHKEEISTVDYSNIEPEKLLKHIQAHYNLEEYKIAKEKLKFLMKDYSDSLNGVDLIKLSQKVDKQLNIQQEKKNQLAEAERKKRLPNAINKMRRVQEGKTVYFFDLNSPEFDTKECFYAYIKKGIYGPELYFRVRYVDTQWLNIENYLITVDQLDYSIEGEVKKSETKGKKAYKHELLDIPVKTAKLYKTLQAIANGKDVLAVYVGKTNYKKRVISAEQRASIQNVLDAYTFLGGTKLTASIEKYTSTDIDN